MIHYAITDELGNIIKTGVAPAPVIALAQAEGSQVARVFDGEVNRLDERIAMVDNETGFLIVRPDYEGGEIPGYIGIGSRVIQLTFV